MSETRESFVRRLFRFAIGFATFLFVAGSLLRLTISDRIAPLSAIYYGTPVVILVFLASFLALSALIHKNKSWALGWCIGAMFWAAIGCSTELRNAPSERQPADELVVLWNMRNGQSGWDGAFHQIRETRPRLAGLVESWHGGRIPTFKTHFPAGYECTDSNRGLTIVAEGTIEEVEEGRLGPNGIYQSALVTIDEVPIRIFLIDIKSNPLFSRRQAFVELRKIVDRHLDERLLVMGDFNTPHDSVHSKLLSAVLKQAFRSHGSGYAATWPLPIPVLELDHFWFNDKIVVTECRHEASDFSDHEMVKVYCRF